VIDWTKADGAHPGAPIEDQTLLVHERPVDRIQQVTPMCFIQHASGWGRDPGDAH